MASWDDLDGAFALPDTLPADSEWRTLYERMLNRVRGELANMDLLTTEILLVERYLTGYVLLRWREGLAIGSLDGFLTAAMAKDVNAHWLSISAQVAALIEKGRERQYKSGDLVSKKDLGAAIAGLLNANQDLNDYQKRELMKQFAGEFDRLGV